ncbi:MAG: GNAT family N-acetyltransferase [Chloroflexota bacterium]
MSIRVERFSEPQRDLWDQFVNRSRNGTFMFCRSYMEYHSERFSDHSLLIYDNARLIALLPATLDGSALVSHGGLSYGGFVTDARMTTAHMLGVFDATLSFCIAEGVAGLRYKAAPHIFQRVPSDEDLYALSLCGAQLERRSVLTVVGAHERIPFQQRRQRSILKARAAGLTLCRADEQLAAYWSLLEAALLERYAARPTHTLSEISYLQRHFPHNIQLYTCFERDTLLAGVLVYESATVARAQYIAANARGRETGALDLLFDHLMNQVFSDKPYFDFGTSHEPTTGVIQSGLIDQKEGFGGRAVIQDSYWLDLHHWQPERIRRALV